MYFFNSSAVLVPTSQAFGPWFALDKQSLSHTRIRPLQTGASSGLIIAPCAGHGITWACPYSPLANRGTQQPVFSLRVPLSFFFVWVCWKRGECGAFFLGCGASSFFLDHFDLDVWHSVERNVQKPQAFLTHSQCVNVTS